MDSKPRQVGAIPTQHATSIEPLKPLLWKLKLEGSFYPCRQDGIGPTKPKLASSSLAGGSMYNASKVLTDTYLASNHGYSARYRVDAPIKSPLTTV
jgi:hypothetical protein